MGIVDPEIARNSSSRTKKEMETIERFNEFLGAIGVPNFLVIGIVLIAIWLLISGIRNGLKKKKGNQED